MWQAVCTVGRDEGGAVAEVGQPVPGQFHQSGFDVHGEHVLAAEPVRQQGGVVSGAGADLQYPVHIMDVERFEHAGHQTGHAGRGQSPGQHEQSGVGVHQGQVVGALMRGPLSGVRIQDVVAGHQFVARYRADGGLPLRGAQLALAVRSSASPAASVLQPVTGALLGPADRQASE